MIKYIKDKLDLSAFDDLEKKMFIQFLEHEKRRHQMDIDKIEWDINELRKARGL